MKYEAKRCPVCREVFSPTVVWQMICGRCRKYYYVNGRNGRTRSIEEARALYLADMAEKRIRVSDLPVAPGCDGCGHWRGLFGGTKTNACHYILDTGEKRPCLPGANCAVRTSEKIYDKQEAAF